MPYIDSAELQKRIDAFRDSYDGTEISIYHDRADWAVDHILAIITELETETMMKSMKTQVDSYLRCGEYR